MEEIIKLSYQMNKKLALTVLIGCGVGNTAFAFSTLLKYGLIATLSWIFIAMFLLVFFGERLLE